MSHPVWVCGLKLKQDTKYNHDFYVTPCMGVWIETSLNNLEKYLRKVTPCMGVWIETIPQLLKASWR